MPSIRIVVPDTGPLITLAKLGCLDALLVFESDVRIVLTDYVEFEATRRRKEFPDAAAIHAFIRTHAGRIEIEQTGAGQNYKKLILLKERLEKDPALAAQLGVDLSGPADPGEMTIVQYVRDLVDSPPGPPVLILAEDDYFLREVSPIPGNAHVVSTRAFLNALPRIANLEERPHIWHLVSGFRDGSEAAKHVDRPAAKIVTTWKDKVLPERARQVVQQVRKGRRP